MLFAQSTGLKENDFRFKIYLTDLPQALTFKRALLLFIFFITPPQKIESAKRCLRYEGNSGDCKVPRRELKRSVNSDPKDEIIKSISNENSTLKAQLLEVQKKLHEKEKELSKLTEEVATLKSEQTEYQRQLQLFQGEYERTRFTYEHVIKRGTMLLYDWPYRE